MFRDRMTTDRCQSVIRDKCNTGPRPNLLKRLYSRTGYGSETLNELEQALVGIYTARCYDGDGSGLELILPSDRTCFFGHGRQALAEGLRRVGVGPGDRVLLPGLIGRGVLASLSVIGAIPAFYAVDHRFCTDAGTLEQIDHRSVRAVVAVNYFGFPQPLGPFRQWCEAHGVPLIEDNAHGFLSADGNIPLGRRGDLGVFSLQKTLALPNGAALVDNRAIASCESMMQFQGSSLRAEWRYRAKVGIKRMMALGNLQAARTILTAIRIARGRTSDATSPLADEVVPDEAFSSLTSSILRRCDIVAEGSRRRSLYRWCSELFAQDRNVQPLFSVLPDGVRPQGFPFHFIGSDPTALIADWWRRGVPIQQWPDRLPDGVLATAPVHYQQVMIVPFLW